MDTEFMTSFERPGLNDFSRSTHARQRSEAVLMAEEVEEAFGIDAATLPPEIVVGVTFVLLLGAILLWIARSLTSAFVATAADKHSAGTTRFLFNCHHLV